VQKFNGKFERDQTDIFIFFSENSLTENFPSICMSYNMEEMIDIGNNK
jgi:hypothetical protein